MKFYWVIVFLYGRSSNYCTLSSYITLSRATEIPCMLMDPLTIKINYSPARARTTRVACGGVACETTLTHACMVSMMTCQIRIRCQVPTKNTPRPELTIEEDKLPPGIVPVDLPVLYTVLAAAVVQQEKPS